MSGNQLARAQIVMIAPGELIRGRINKSLFPAGRNWKYLREEVETSGYRQEHAIVIRTCTAAKKGYEILDGLGRATVAAEKGIELISAVLLEVDDNEALRYAVEANLYAGRARTQLSLPQAILLAKAHEASGGEYRVKPILNACGVSEPTYKRAYTSLIFGVETLQKDHPKLAKLGLAETVAESVKHKLWPDFTEFFTGRMPVNTFREKHYAKSEKAEKERHKQKAYKKAHNAREGESAQTGKTSDSRETAAQAVIDKQPSRLELCLSFLRWVAHARLFSSNELHQVEGQLQDCSGEELARVVNNMQALNKLAGRLLKNKEAAKRRALRNGSRQGELPLPLA